ncbi:MAG: hypothetical protein IKL14_03425 [Alphaproteobacteria bacterium]|nr:hypothetical protein [Alphaproteobacteria bacterium]
MNTKANIIALRLLNLYRQEHVIIGGWAAVNPIFVNEATDDVIKELREMPTGKSLIQHIENLRSGKTNMDSINPELLPYGGQMMESISSVALTGAQWTELENAIIEFTPDQTGLDKFVGLGIIKNFGNEWPVALRAVLTQRPQLMQKLETIIKTYNAYKYWGIASEIVNTPLTERVRAQVQADMPEYETYLPMFGSAGAELLEKLRNLVSSIN